MQNKRLRKKKKLQIYLNKNHNIKVQNNLNYKSLKN